MNKKDTSLKVSMNFVICLLMFLMFAGCASRQLPSSAPPAWDSDIPFDYKDAETPSASKSLSNILSDGDNYHFRKVKWGYSRERVELSGSWKYSN